MSAYMKKQNNQYLTLIIYLAACLLANSMLAETAPIGWNVTTAGAKGDDVTDNTAIFQQLLNEAGKAGGGVVEVPAGRFRINGHLSIPANVTLQGIYPGFPIFTSQANVIDIQWSRINKGCHLC
jgi:hypothetical protein